MGRWPVHFHRSNCLRVGICPGALLEYGSTSGHLVFHHWFIGALVCGGREQAESMGEYPWRGVVVGGGIRLFFGGSFVRECKDDWVEFAVFGVGGGVFCVDF